MKKFTGEYFDIEYFKPGIKSNYAQEYTWQNEKAKVEHKAAALRDKLNPHKVLDIGCAKGFMVRALCELKIDAWGVDISQYAIDNAEPDYKQRLKVCDIRDEALPFSPASFDAIYCDNVLEHVEDEYVDFVLSEISRVLKPLGTAVLQLPVGLGLVNKPVGEASHVNYSAPAYWISKAWKFYLNTDLRRSMHASYGHQGAYQNLILILVKGRLKNE